MYLVRRDVLVVSPKERYLNWAKSVFEDTTDRAWQEPGETSSAFLIGEMDSHDESSCRVAMEAYWKRLAHVEFERWSARASDWPELQTLADFESYFRWKIHGLFGDFGGGALVDAIDFSSPGI